jgi:hypothetical protein
MVGWLIVDDKTIQAFAFCTNKVRHARMTAAVEGGCSEQVSLIK